MKISRYAVFFLLLIIFGCAQKSPGKKVLARINNYEISKDEFYNEFKESIFGAQEDAQASREFLNHLINQKLILQDAQEKGFDKKKEFLSAIENFWEQTLLKMALEKKIQEFTGSFTINQQEIRSLYNSRVQAGIINSTYEQAWPLLQKEISKNKEMQALSAWIDKLRKKAKIQVNEQLLE